MNEILYALKNTLEKIPVSGEENINRMLACITLVNKLIETAEVQDGSNHHE